MPTKPAELEDNAIGFHITDLAMGIMVMASTVPLSWAFTSPRSSMSMASLVGIDGLTAEAPLTSR
jgi:hypothetical protein